MLSISDMIRYPVTTFLAAMMMAIGVWNDSDAQNLVNRSYSTSGELMTA